MDKRLQTQPLATSELHFSQASISFCLGLGFFFFCQQNTLSSSITCLRMAGPPSARQSLLPALFVLLLNLAGGLGLGG